MLIGYWKFETNIQHFDPITDHWSAAISRCIFVILPSFLKQFLCFSPSYRLFSTTVTDEILQNRADSMTQCAILKNF